MHLNDAGKQLLVFWGKAERKINNIRGCFWLSASEFHVSYRKKLRGWGIRSGQQEDIFVPMEVPESDKGQTSPSMTLPGPRNDPRPRLLNHWANSLLPLGIPLGSF